MNPSITVEGPGVFADRDPSIFTDLVEGRAQCRLFQSSSCEDALRLVVDTVLDDGIIDVEISSQFSPAHILDELVDQHALFREPGAVDLDAKPVFDALRAELEQMIARIDALRFSGG